MKPHPSLVIFCYLAVFLVWGSTYLFIGIGVETIPPAFLVAARFFLAGAGMILITILSGQVKAFPSGKEILSALFLGFFLQFLGNGFVTLGEQKVPSYLAALIIGSTPLIVAIFNRIFHGEPLTFIKILGATVGLGGVGVLLFDGKSLEGTFSPEILLILAGSLAWGLGTSWAHRLSSHKNVFFHSGMQMLFGGALAWGISLFNDPPVGQILAHASWPSLFSLGYLTIVGGATIAAYNYLLAVEPSFKVTSYALINPVIAVLLGVILHGELPTPYLWYGVPLIIAGVGLMLYGPLIHHVIREKLRRAKV